MDQNLRPTRRELTTRKYKERGMDKEKKEGDVFEAIEGLTPVDPKP